MKELRNLGIQLYNQTEKSGIKKVENRSKSSSNTILRELLQNRRGEIDWKWKEKWWTMNTGLEYRLIDYMIKKKGKKKEKETFSARDNVNVAFVSVFLSRAP